MATRFAAAGAYVGCIDVDAVALDQVVEAIRRSGGRVQPETADVSDWGGVQVAAERLHDTLGPARIVIANAGIVHDPRDVAELDVEVWERVVAVDLTGAFLTAKAAIPQLRQRPGGVIVFISSVGGLRAAPGYGAYVAAKHGVVGLMGTLANELADDGIRVNAVCPGTVDTPMLDGEAAALGLERDAALEIWSAQHLIKRLITPDEVADAVLWLSSEEARMVTGVAFPLDGGLLQRWAP
jgi:NAD(P)-dependent dehydrogenase (short-subunit alcohol dehydrogenase family)